MTGWRESKWWPWVRGILIYELVVWTLSVLRALGIATRGSNPNLLAGLVLKHPTQMQSVLLYVSGFHGGLVIIVTVALLYRKIRPRPATAAGDDEE